MYHDKLAPFQENKKKYPTVKSFNLLQNEQKTRTQKFLKNTGQAT